jgi:hypothetical protein
MLLGDEHVYVIANKLFDSGKNEIRNGSLVYNTKCI